MVAQAERNGHTSNGNRQGASGPNAPQQYRVRIVDFRLVPAADIVLNRKNPRRHPRAQKSALQASLRSVGLAGALLTRQLPDGRLELIDGELRTTTVRDDQPMPCLVTDLTEAEADRVLAEHDAITLMADYDSSRSEALAALLAAREEEATAHLLRVVAETNPGAELLAALAAEEAAPPFGAEPWDEAADDDEGGEGGSEESGDQESSPGAQGPETLAWDADDPDMADEEETAPPAVPVVFDHAHIIDAAAMHYRATGFPYRKLPVYISMQRINKLASKSETQLLRTYAASDVADTYHPHRFHAAANGMRSPYDGFQDDVLLRKAITFRLEGVGSVEDGYLPAMSVVTGVQACYNFRPGFACYLYRKYAQPGDTVLDSSTGYGGRLVGFMASGIADPSSGMGRYIGIDPNTATHAGNLRMAKELGFASCVELYNLPAEDVDPALLRERVDFAFTSPPYFARELYSDEETQSYKRYPTGGDWRAGFLRRMLSLNYAALRPGKLLVLNIDNVTIRGTFYPLVDWALEEARAVGFEHVETKYFDFASSAMGAGHDPGEAGSEPVLIFRKPAVPPIGSGGDAPGVSVTGAAADPSLVGYTPAASHGLRSAAVERIVRAPAHPRTLAQWMHRLYTVSAKEQWLHGDLGIWPAELGAYLEGLCLTYSPASATIRLMPGLIEPQHEQKPHRQDTCLVLYSGGKDSMAVAAQVAAAGYDPHCVYLRRVNRVYPHEITFAEQSAKSLGYRFTVVTPPVLPAALGESVIKNQWCWAVALDALDYIPGAVALGSYAIDDCHTTAWYSDFEVAFRAFAPVVAAAWGEGCVRFAPLPDELAALRIWATLPLETRQYTASCMMPARNKPVHRRRTLEQGIPVYDYDCGVCEKCVLRAWLLWAHGIETELEYPPEYLMHAEKRIEKALADALWCHADTRLCSPLVPAGTSTAYLLDHVFGGRLTRLVPRIVTAPAVAPRLVRLAE